jgi:hypothetical protein
MKPFWDVEEDTGFTKVKAWDGHEYKVWNCGAEQVKQKVANILANVRRDMNKLLKHIWDVRDVPNITFERKRITWQEHPIAFGIYHTFDIHMPNGDPYGYVYQEMTPNKHGILGLNKPKEIVKKQYNYNGKMVDYEIANRRLMLLTIRPKISDLKPDLHCDTIDSYDHIMKLVLHEITHTTCNDVRWKKDNHLHPFHKYEALIKKWAKECKII